MNPYHQGKLATIYYGDCRELSLENITALVTDPPYELGFMGKDWDQKGVSFQIETWQYLRGLCLSGSPLLSFGGTRTFHRIACAIEDAGWEIRDTIMWVYGSGFPKSLNIGKVIDKAARGVPQGGSDPTSLHHGRYATQRSIGKRDADDKGQQYGSGSKWMADGDGWKSENREVVTEAKPWEGYGTALKPAYEPIILGMNPLDGTFAENALKHKVAGLNIDGCRIEGDKRSPEFRNPQSKGIWQGVEQQVNWDNSRGRFPANFIHDGSQMVMELFPNSKTSGQHTTGRRMEGNLFGMRQDGEHFGDNGSAARFFYCAKASKTERGDNNAHPTVKPLALMEYLVKLVKMPEYNLVLDPFMGSGTTLLACIKLGIPCIGIDNDEHTCEIAARRCANELGQLVCT